MAQVEPVIYHELEGPTPVPEGWENRPKQIKVTNNNNNNNVIYYN